MIAFEDLEALLEERPYQVDELASLFERSAADVLDALALAAIPVCEKCCAAFLPKPHAAGRFCSHACANQTTAATRRRVVVPPRVDPDTVLAQLQAGPRGRTAIARALNVGRKAVQNRLDALAATGQIKSVGTGTGLRWALASWIAPVLTSPGPRHRETSADGTRLRQAKAAPVMTDVEPSWWVAARPAGFTDVAREHAERMRNSKEHFLDRCQVYGPADALRDTADRLVTSLTNTRRTE